MSVQAQYPSNVLLSEFRKRAQPEACNGIEDLSVQENLLHLYSAGVNFLPPPALNEGAVAESGLARNIVSARKKPRVNEAVMTKQQISFAPFALESERFMVPYSSERSTFAVPPLNLQQSAWPCSSGMPSAFENTVRCAPTATSTGRLASPPSMRFIPDAYLQLHYCQQEAEIDQIIRTHGEQLKQALEEKRQQHTRALLELIDHCVLSRVRERLVEIEKVRQRNVELEDCVKKLSLESQVWMNVAHSHEALVTTLRSNLEQVVAQSKKQSKGRFGESDAEDAQVMLYTLKQPRRLGISKSTETADFARRTASLYSSFLADIFAFALIAIHASVIALSVGLQRVPACRFTWSDVSGQGIYGTRKIEAG